MKTQEIVDFIFEIAPQPAWAEENVFEYGDGSCEVSGIGVAWWITSDILQAMISKGLNFGLTHETVTYELPDWYHWGKIIKTDELEANRRIKELAMKNDIAIHRFHSNIDVVGWGMPHALVEQLGWQEYSADWSRGVPVVEIPPCTLHQLIREIKEKLQLPFVRYDGDLNRIIHCVAIAWGGLCQGWGGVACAAPLGFDVIIGGDIIDGVVRLAREQGWATIDAMHHATEMEAMKVLAAKVQEKFPSLHVEFFENSMPWAVL